MDKIDNLWKALGGRKFLAFILGTVMLYLGKITDDIWLITFITYCGANIAQKLGLKFKEVGK